MADFAQEQAQEKLRKRKTNVLKVHPKFHYGQKDVFQSRTNFLDCSAFKENTAQLF